MSQHVSKDPLHGVTLEKILIQLVELHGWRDLANRIEIRCFMFDPSISSSLQFLRKTPWARTKVEELYSYARRTGRIPEPLPEPPAKPKTVRKAAPPKASDTPSGPA